MQLSPQTKYYRRNKDRINEAKREAYKNPEIKSKHWEAVKKSRAKYPIKVKEWRKKQGKVYRKKYTEELRTKHAEQWRNLRQDTMDAIGGEMCRRCGFDDTRTLHIDHINGGGGKHTRSFSSNKAYHHYVKSNPSEFQVLCANCNCIKRAENNENRKPNVME